MVRVAALLDVRYDVCKICQASAAVYCTHNVQSLTLIQQQTGHDMVANVQLVDETFPTCCSSSSVNCGMLASSALQ